MKYKVERKFLYSAFDILLACSKCGETVDGEFNFCPTCGKRLMAIKPHPSLDEIVAVLNRHKDEMPMGASTEEVKEKPVCPFGFKNKVFCGHVNPDETCRFNLKPCVYSSREPEKGED